MFPADGNFDGTLADVGDVIGGATPSKKKPEYYCSNGIGWITPRDLSNTNDKFIAHGADDITKAGYDSCSAKLLPKGSVLFSSRAPIGYIAIAADGVATNQGFKSVVPKEEIGTAFIYCFLTRNKQRIADMGAGTTFPEVSGKMMKSVGLAVPSKSACAEFSSFAAPILAQQEVLERENRKHEALRDALLPKLMSGEIEFSKIDPTQLNSHLVNQAIRRFVARCEVGYGAIRKSSLINLAVALRVFQKKGRYRLANAFDIPSEINCKMKFSIVFRCFFPNPNRTRANQQLIIRCENMKSNVVVFR